MARMAEDICLLLWDSALDSADAVMLTNAVVSDIVPSKLKSKRRARCSCYLKDLVLKEHIICSCSIDESTSQRSGPSITAVTIKLLLI